MRKIFKYKALILTALILMVAVMNLAMVDFSHAQSTEKRLEIIEKQLKAVQRRVFTPGSKFPRPSSSGQTAPSTITQGNVAFADMEARISQIETQVRQMTGQVEESNFRIEQLNSKLETLVRDYEFRLAELEKKSQGGVSATSPVTVPQKKTQEKTQEEAQTAALPAGSEQDQYAFAQGLVSKGDYAGAEAALKLFLKRFPKSNLAGNAQYWLGQTYYSRKLYTQSTRAFLEGYNAYPESPKAPAFLLKIGMSLFAMGEKTDACDAYRELSLRFPKSTENLKRRPSEEKKAGCQ